MSPEQITTLLYRLEQIVFLLQVAAVGLGFLAGVGFCQFLIHCKNQKHLF